MAVVFNGEPSDVLRPGEELEIVGFYELLNYLGIEQHDEPSESMATTGQLAAIDGWLASNDCGSMLQDALAEHGIFVGSLPVDGACSGHACGGVHLEISDYFQLLEHVEHSQPAVAGQVRYVSDERVAIAAWLRANRPSQVLAESLKEQGFVLR